MLAYLVRRLLSSIAVLLLVSLLAFCVILIVPGDPAAMFLDAGATPAQIERIRRELGLDQPFWSQVVEWYGRILRGDLGRSILLGRSVTAAILERLPVTLSLAGLALIVAIILGVVAGVIAAMRHDSWADQSIMTLALLGLSLPDFWLGLVLMFLFAVVLGVLPSGGFVPIGEDFLGWATYMILPAGTLAVSQMGLIARMTRSSMLEVLNQDFVRTAHAKGLESTYVVVRHGLPNAMIPILTVIGIIVGGLLGGAVVIEQVFSLPGVGRLIIGAIMSRDFPVIQGGLLFLAVVYLVVNIVIDLLYAVIDPRVRLE
jgi:peptide/nickel transport system permease protein